jgi:signal transduction histidine kinase
MTTTTQSMPQARSEPSLCVGSHPLLIFPIFRRIPSSIPRDFVYTLIWNALMAALFTLLYLVFDPPPQLDSAVILKYAWPNLVFANCIGFIIHLEFMVGDLLTPAIRNRGMAVRAAYYSALPIAGVFAGYWLATSLLRWDAVRSMIFTGSGLVSIGALSLLVSGLLLAIFIPRERAAKAEAAFERERSRVAAAEKQATQAELKLLQAQVEPHFLYNTLANVVSLVDDDPATAKRMLERLITLLRGASFAAGSQDPTLSAQVEHLRAYLDLMVLRMGTRLSFHLDIPSELGALRLPALLLQPLVENAIEHGLEPKVEGGEIVVTARRTGDELLLAVADTGKGFAATRVTAAPGKGIGLSNLRERLHALYGEAACLTVEDNAPSGARVTIRLSCLAAI